MRRLAACLAVACAAVPMAAARAQSIDAFLGQGYNVVRTTYVSGAFEGCTKNATVVFADGSRFLCGATRPQYVYQPRVSILRKGTGVPTVVIVGGRPLKGALVQMGQQHFPVPLSTQEDPLDLADPPPTPPQTGAISAVEPIQSLNALQQELSTRLNDAQSKPINVQIAPTKR